MNWFYNLRINYKFLLCFGLLTIAINICGYSGISGLKLMSDHSRIAYETMLVPVSDLGEIATYFQNSRVDLRDLIQNESQTDAQAILDRMGKRKEDLAKRVSVFRSTILTDSVRNLFRQFEEAESVYSSEVSRIVDLHLKGEKAAAQAELFSPSYVTASANEQALLEKLVKMKLSVADMVCKKDLSISNERSLIMSGLIAFSILLSILSWVFLSKSIAKPVKGLEQAARAVGEGNLNVSLEHSSKDEFGQLTDTFRNMLTKIKDEIALSESLKKGFQIPFLIADRQLNITYYNEAAEAMFGYPASAVVNKMKAIDIVGRDKGIRATLQGNPVSEVRFETSDSSGNKVPVLASSGIIRDGSGQITAAFILLNDLRKDQAKQEQYLKEQTVVISEALEKLAKGDLTAEVNMEKESPLYGLGRNLSSAINSLRDVLSRVHEAVQATASAANQISSSSEEMAAGSHEQSQQTAEVVGSVEQMTKTIMDSTQNAARASENSRLASSNAVEGTKKVEDTKKGMLKIVEATRKTGGKISSLTKKTEQIGEITQVIDDIADQTNLLALNAAIEAARAGEQGRGFAVVADEVRKLAERTTKATKEIAETIKAIQGEALEADSSMEEAGIAVEDGMRLTEDVAVSLNKIFEMNDKVLDIITQVAASSEEQSSAAEEISKNIEGISTVTQQSAAGTEQIAKAAEDLNRLTVNLQDLISRFTLAGTDRSIVRI